MPSHDPHDHHGNPAPDAVDDHAGAAVTDPVCGMQVDAEASFLTADHKDTTYHFCSARCRERFIAEPARYLSSEPLTPEAPAPSGIIYTCPMHPQIRQEGPGACPICGMALDPEIPTLEDEGNPEFRDFTSRFWWTLPLAPSTSSSLARSAGTSTPRQKHSLLSASTDEGDAQIPAHAWATADGS